MIEQIGLENIIFNNSSGMISGVTPEISSRFAKIVCGDLNPIHNAENKNFVVPGDLLFTLFSLMKGLKTDMDFSFNKSFNGEGFLQVNNSEMKSSNNRKCVDIKYNTYNEDNHISSSSNFTNFFLLEYCALSGDLFSDYLPNILRKHDVVLDLDSSLIMYRGIKMNLNKKLIDESSGIELEVSNIRSELKKRLELTIDINIYQNKNIVGSLSKYVVCSKLKSTFK